MTTQLSPEPASEEIRCLADCMVVMRDGVHLATDVYLPAGGSGPWPVIVERTPYDKCGISRSERSVANPQSQTRAAVAGYLVRAGYAVVMQDCRGRYGSEGTFTKYLSEADDGHDTLHWILGQTWCDGRIGTMGLSYGAHTQCALASTNPPGLACMFMDSGGFSSAYHGGIRRGGAFELKQATWAYRHALLSPETAADPVRRANLESEDIAWWFRHMPWCPGHSPLRHAPEYEAYLFEQWQHGRFDDYWRRRGLYAEGYYDQFPDVPVAIVGSWYDPYVRTCITNFRELASRHNSAHSLLMGPWTHGNRSDSWAGGVDFGTGSTLDGNIADDYASYRLSWFQRWLPTAPVAVKPEPCEDSVTWFEMGGGSGQVTSPGRLSHGGRWRSSSSWPPATATPEYWYLACNGRLVSSANPEHQWLEYRSDPTDPVPTIGGALTSGEPVMQGGAFDQRYCPGRFGYCDTAEARPLADRPDVLVFRSEPLAEDLVVSGPVTVELWISSDRPDTDFTAKLIDEYPPSADYPDGFAMNITDGIFRARYREGWDREATLNPGEIVPIRIEPFDTSNRFVAGHRLRLDVASSNFPHFDVNPNTGGPEGVGEIGVLATNRIHIGGTYGSRISLSIDRYTGSEKSP